MFKGMLFALSLAASALGVAAEAPAERFVAETVKQFEDSQGGQIADKVLSAVNVKAISRFTLGRHGRALSEAEKSRFADAMKAFLRRQVEKQAAQLAAADVEIVRTVERNEHDAIVTTKVSGPGDPVTLRWRVIERGGHWAVVDLEFSGVWLAIEQRAQVDAILNRPGSDIEDVIDRFG